MESSLQRFNLFFVVFICTVSLGLSSCENPGAVGTELTKSGAEVVTDTLIIDGVQAIEPNSYSGALSFYSAGQYDDPLFGSMTATGYIKPALPSDSDTVRADAKMLLRITLDANQIYGDSLAAQDFNIYEVDELWRSRALKINDDLQVNTNELVGSFTVGTEDSLNVELSDEWVDKYRQFSDTTNADSLYKYNMFGLALVPANSGKIIPFNTGLPSTRFVIQNPEDDTLEVFMREFGYTLERSGNNSFPQGSVPLYSTYESVLNFGDFQVSDLDIQASGLSKAELVLYENRSAMEQSLQPEPAAVRRTHETTVYLHLADPEEVPENIDPGAPVNNISRIQGVYSASDGSYRFDVTGLVENLLRSEFPSGQEYFVTFPNDGVIKPSLIYTDSDQVPADKKPKIIITSLKNQQ